MSEKFFKREFIPPEEKNLHQFNGKNFKEVIEYFEGREENEFQDKTGEKEWKEYLDRENQSIFDGFLDLLREKGIRVSTSEWLQFLQVIRQKTSAEELKEMVSDNQLLNKIRLFAKTTLVKDKGDEFAFHEAFNEYFKLAIKAYNRELYEEEKVGNNKDNRDSDTEPEIKEQLGIDEIDENLDLSKDKEHNDDEKKHGGKKDQHNDILKKEDLAKLGGGDKKDREINKENKRKSNEDKEKERKGEQNKVIQEGLLIGGGKGKSIYAEHIQNSPITHEGKNLTRKDIQERERKARKVDRRQRYEIRPDKASMREIIRNLRRIITDVSEIKSSSIDLKKTVRNFARRDFRFNYEQKREKQPEVVLLIDIGGPVDEWSPLVKEVAEEMARGLTKLEVYLFHNNLYGYVWKPESEDLLSSSYAQPNSLINIKKVIKKRKKIIIYGDAEMSYSEFEDDCWPPSNNNERVKNFGMRGDKCLKFIKKKADSVVWINPVFAREWEERDDSGSIEAISDIISMHDLTVGGVEDAIKELMKKK